MSKAKIKCYICHRLEEPSSWIAFRATLGFWAEKMPEPYNYYIYSVAAFCGILGILLQEGKNGNNAGVAGEQISNTAVDSPVSIMDSGCVDNPSPRRTKPTSKPNKSSQGRAKTNGKKRGSSK